MIWRLMECIAKMILASGRCVCLESLKELVSQNAVRVASTHRQAWCHKSTDNGAEVTENATDKRSTRRRTLARVLKPIFVVAAIYVAIVVIVFIFQRSLLYFPTHHNPTSALKPWTVGGQTIGYMRDVERPEAVWLLMHGNAGQASERSYVIDSIPATDSLYVLEYPGYGSREGKPKFASINRAASEAYRVLREAHPNLKVGVIGESIGSGPASLLAKEAIPPDKIVLITPFDSLVDVAARRFIFLPVRLLLIDRWDNRKALANYKGPVDIYGAVDDRVIPVRHAKRLVNAIPNARFFSISGGHNDWSNGQKVKIGW